MKYSYEYKKQCVELYLQGKWAEAPEGLRPKRFHDKIREWVRITQARGIEGLKPKGQMQIRTAEEKYELVAKVLAGASVTETAISAGIASGVLHRWVRRYKIKGYKGLAAPQIEQQSPEESEMKKKASGELTASEREEMIRLREENEYLRTENEVIKKRIALRREIFAAQLKAKKLHSSKSSAKKDTP